ncbi:hypothetical protein L211DRAFT_860397 [Terfezia boudieri ATCC MYA-4762]|uniref:Uncharacterized protein n=1 Tax=Terfezia boudieri ATCC MYA-4762 TaxID=1051890 RepID=A0A3N4LZ45_9PEZI|nr:hypothetical protein L211DRAFT_860397 [Terfezia boudieri ATCC MYA-4762]
MPIDRSLGRNVKFYDATSPEVALGGMIQNGSVTEGNFLDMLGILLITETPIRVQERGSGHIVMKTNNRLEAGHYDVYCDSPINVNNGPWVFRLISHNVSGRDGAFMTGIRVRDGKCVISGVMNPRLRGNMGQWITDMDDTNGSSKINSLQNGMLLPSNIHQMFDQYLISVNPDIIVFDEDYLGLDGRVLDPVCRDPNNEHRMAISDNMRGAGEPIFEHDFSSGDMME